MQRSVSITGRDIAYYFTMTDYYTLWLLAATDREAVGFLAAGLTQGNPGDIARDWYERIMRDGVMAGTQIPYQQTKLPFNVMMAQRFDKFDAIVPFTDYFLGIDGAWFNKFHAILPFPFYEFFVTTAQDDSYKASGGFGFHCTGLGSTKAGTPTVVARLNPLPQLVTSAGPGGDPSFDSIDTSLWAALPEFDLGGDQFFMQSDITFSEDEAANFYAVNPTFFTGQFGQDNSNINQFLFNYAVVWDQASVARYGYRPSTVSIPWMSDSTGNTAQSSSAMSRRSSQRFSEDIAGTMKRRHSWRAPP